MATVKKNQPAQPQLDLRSYRDIVGTRQHLQVPFEVDRAADVDEEKRTVEMSILSDQPIRQWWFGRVVLDMKKKSVRMDRIKAGAPLLLNHRTDQQIGVLENVRIEDGKLRATARFSRSAMAEEIFQDVKDGIRRNTSGGFVIHEIKLEARKDGEEDLYRALDWEPLEASIASIPADITVGTGRSLDESTDEVVEEETDPGEEVDDTEERAKRTTPAPRSKAMDPVATTTPVAPPAAPTPAQLLQARTNEFVETAALFGETDDQKARFRTMARSLALDDAKTLEDLKRDILAAMKSSQDPVATTAPATVAARQGVVPIRRYQSLRVFKGPGGDERAYRFGMAFLGNVLAQAPGLDHAQPRTRKMIESAAQYCREHGLIQRATGQVEGLNEQGGFTVQEEWSQDFIDLREQYGKFRRLTKIEPMGAETKTILRRTGGLSFYAAGEEDTASTSAKTWDRVGLVAKKWLSFGKMSSEITEDSLVNQADDLANEMAYAAAKLEDDCGFNGDGTGDATSATGYQGITGVRNKLLNLSSTRVNIAGLVVGSGNLWSELVLADFEDVVARLPEYADTPNAAWICHRTFYFSVMKKLLLAQSGSTATEAANLRQPDYLGYPVVFSQAFPKTQANDQVPVIFGDLAQGSRLGNRSDLTIMLSEHSSFASDAIDIRGRIRLDINVHDVGNASGTAADRVPGPIVGLLTAAA